MRSAESAHDAATVWDIATPSRPGLLPGVSMAGFSARTTEFFDLSVIPYPAVTVAVSLGDEPFTVDDSNGRQQNGSVVVGLVLSGVRGRGRDIECLQVRLSPVVAHAVLGVSSELGGMVVSSTTSGAATPHEPKSDCALPGHGTTGSRSRRRRSSDDTRQAERSRPKSPSCGGRW